MRRRSVAEFTTEAALAAGVVLYLQEMGWAVYQEVTGVGTGRRADIVATQGPLVWVVEAKLRFNLEVVAQAWDWRPWAHYLSVAVPFQYRETSGTRLLKTIAEERGVGVMYVRPGHALPQWTSLPREERDWIARPTADAERGPRLFRRAPRAAELRAVLCDEQKTIGTAGSNRGGYWTPWKRTVQAVRGYVQNHPGCTTRELVDAIAHHYTSDSSARSTLPRWGGAGMIDGVRVDTLKRPWRWYPREEAGT